MAKVVSQQGWGGTEVLTVEDRIVPEPGAGQVRLDQKAIGFNFFDVLQRRGILSANEPGRVMGIEGAGQITAVGSGTQDFAVGDRVAYFRSQGAYASERLIEESVLVKIPDGIAFDEAAALMVKGVMAWLSAKKLFSAQPGQTVLVTTAAGGIGSLVTRMATWRGARVIGVVGSAAKRDAALANGTVDVAVGLSDGLALALDATSGKGVDALLDGISAGVAEAAVLRGAVRKGGAIVSFGSAGGWVTADADAIADRGVTHFNPLASDFLRTPEERRAKINEVFDLMLSAAFGELPITRYPLKASQLHHDVCSRPG